LIEAKILRDAETKSKNISFSTDQQTIKEKNKKFAF